MSLRLGALAVVFSVAFHAVGVHAQAGSAPWGVVAQPVGSVAVQDSGGTRSVSQAIADYRKLKKRHAPVVDVWLALDSLGQFDDPRIVDLAIEEFESEDIERYATARQLIGGLATADSLNRVLTLGVGHEEARVRAQVILALGEGQPTALDWITPVEAALDDGVAMVRAAAVEALGRARDSGSLDRILQLAEDGSVRVRQRVPETLVQLASDRSLPVLRQLGQDPSWRVRSAVVRALGRLGRPSASAELVEIFDRENGRVREDAYRELKALAKVDFGANAEAWRRYFMTTRSSASGPDDEMTGMRTTAPVAPLSPVTYFGLPVLSQRFVLLVDVSASMTTLEKPPRNDDPEAEKVSRLALMKDELNSLMLEFGPEVALDLVSFSDRAESWKGRLVPMNASHRADARQEIRGFRAVGMTNLREALTICFDMAQNSLEDAALESSSPDTLYVLADGSPSNVVRLLMPYAAERNRDLQLRIHCICLSDLDSAVTFMRGLAELGQGTYTNPLE